MGKAVLGVIVLLILLAIAIAVYPSPLSVHGFSIQLPRLSAQSPASLTVKDQPPLEKQVVVEEAVFDKPGFVVVHADNEGAPGEVIGSSALLTGKQAKVPVPVNPLKTTAKIHVMLHYDSDSDGAYSSPDEDVPITVKGKIVVTPMNLLPFLSVSNQPHNSSKIRVSSLFLDKTGFVVVHADENGTFGKVIGNSEPLIGYRENLRVTINLQKATPRLHVMLHYDDNNDRVYGFPDEDAPVAVNGNIVVAPMLLLPSP